MFILKGRGTIGVWDGGRGQLPPSFEKSTIFRAAAVFFGQRSQNKECLNATCKAWEVPFPAIWEAFLAKIFLRRYAPTDGGAPLRLYHDGSNSAKIEIFGQKNFAPQNEIFPYAYDPITR